MYFNIIYLNGKPFVSIVYKVALEIVMQSKVMIFLSVWAVIEKLFSRYCRRVGYPEVYTDISILNSARYCAGTHGISHFLEICRSCTWYYFEYKLFYISWEALNKNLMNHNIFDKLIIVIEMFSERLTNLNRHSSRRVSLVASTGF